MADVKETTVSADKISDYTLVPAFKKNGKVVEIKNIKLNSIKITSKATVVTPTADTDATTKKYVDDINTALNTKISLNTTNINGLTSTVNTVSTQVTTNKNDIATLKTNVSSLSNTVTTNNNNITTQLSSINSQLSTMNTTLTSVKTKVDGLVDGNNTAY